jgi:DnaK suppressor protein
MIESKLQARLEHVLRTRELMQRESDGARDAELSHFDNHPGEYATELHDEELDVTTGIFLEEEERRIAEARRALAEGTYGVCWMCRRPIPEERLQAVPEAVRCLDCQRHFEGYHRQRTPL